MGNILSDAYDIVCNGYEIAEVPFVFTTPMCSERFWGIGLGMDEARNKFGFWWMPFSMEPLLTVVLRWDLTVGLCFWQKNNIRGVIAFPKTTIQDLWRSFKYCCKGQLDELYVCNTQKMTNPVASHFDTLIRFWIGSYWKWDTILLYNEMLGMNWAF